MKFPSFLEFTSKATAAFKRFPLTLAWAVLGSFFVMIIINSDDDNLFEEQLNTLLTLVLGVSWFISAQFFIEQFKKPKKLWWVKVLVLVFLIVLYISLPPHYLDYGKEVPYLRYTMYFLAGHLTLLCAPFILSWHDGAYFNYLKNIMIALARSVLFSGVLYLGLVIAMVAMVFLFEIDFDDIRYAQLFVFCLGIVNTWVYLADFPKNIQFNLKINFNNATSVFVKFILIPLAVLYILILYVYSIKIIISWELPQGWVSYLILALSVLLFTIQFILHPVRHMHKSSLIRHFSPLCYWFLIPLLPLLYIAIFRRVTDYGITENRYFLLVLAVFITGSAIYLLFSRKKQLRFLPIALIFLIFLTSLGPWGAFSVSENSQLAQMKLLIDTFPSKNTAQNNKTSDTLAITNEQASRLRSISRYLMEHGKLSEAESFLGYDPVMKFKDENSYAIGDAMITDMGFEVREPNYSENQYLSFFADLNDAINIEGYDVMRDLYFNGANKKAVEIYNGFTLTYNAAHQKLAIKKEGYETLEISLETFIENLKGSSSSNYGTIAEEEMRLFSENKDLKVTFIFKNIAFEKLNGIDKLQNCQFLILLKMKKDAE